MGIQRTCSESLHDWRARNEALLERVVNSTRDLSDEAVHQQPDPGIWSPAQVVEHMVLGHRPYLQAVRDGLTRAVKQEGDPPIRHSFCGKLLIKIVPDTNTRPHKTIYPNLRPAWPDVLEEWQKQQTQLFSMLDQAVGIDLSHTWVRNPFLRIVRMNLADFLEILTAHGELHVGQIEQRVPQRVPVQ